MACGMLRVTSTTAIEEVRALSALSGLVEYLRAFATVYRNASQSADALTGLMNEFTMPTDR